MFHFFFQFIFIIWIKNQYHCSLFQQRAQQSLCKPNELNCFLLTDFKSTKQTVYPNRTLISVSEIFFKYVFTFVFSNGQLCYSQSCLIDEDYYCHLFPGHHFQSVRVYTGSVCTKEQAI